MKTRLKRQWRGLAATLLAVGASASQVAGPPASGAVSAAPRTTGDAVARVGSGTAELSSGRVERTWRIPAVGAVGAMTTSLVDNATGRNWSAPTSNDLAVSLGGLTLTSATLALEAVEASTVPGDPRIPGAPPGARVAFRYSPLTPGTGIEIHRDFTTFTGSAVIEVDTRIVNTSASALRVSSFSLDELASETALTSEVERYVGGSDWRDDFRKVSVEAAPFDVEGEVLRLDDGGGQGWFTVSERRGGAMSRAGRDAAGRNWVGVEYQRDLFDYGPLMSSPPDYNRLTNPTYPAGGRQRTLAPHGTMRLGRAYTGVYHGGAQEAARAFSEHFTVHDMPAYPRSVGLNSFHPWNHGPGLNDANMRAQARAGQGLGLESFMLDDQWQGQSSGDWNFDPTRFPDSRHNGTPDFVRHLAATGMGFALWMSPVEFNSSSHVAAAHPEWVCTPSGQVTRFIQDQAGLGVWDVTNTSFQAYLAGVVDRAVTQWQVREFKFDFQAWVDCGVHDYLDYEDAFVDMVRGFQQRHPGVTFELDETNDQRAWPFESAAIGPSWFDNGHTDGGGHRAGLSYVSKELHDLWSAAPWLPPSSIGFGLFDDYLRAPYSARYLLPMALLSHFTFWTDLTRLPPADAAETRWWTAWYEAQRDSIPRFAYEDTAADPADGHSWMALQPWSGDSGYLFVFRQAGPDATQPIRLQGLVAEHSYSLTDVRTGQVLGTFSGARAMAGLPVNLGSPYASAVIAVVGSGSCAGSCAATSSLPNTSR
ncbi:MAG: alpha-galactosidase [Candidatus Dormibacteraeota bacterium]|nr:alpha-galactosidase [Candidatus Dormibacteraeota bacterium]